MYEAPTVEFHALSRPHGASADLGESDIHVWRSRLEIPRGDLGKLERTLTAGERERITSRASEVDRRRATVSRGLLRNILAGYVERPAAELAFTYGPAGKPEMSAAGRGEPLHFNSTHSGDVLLVAVGRVPSLGIDVERIRPVARFERVARRAFSEEERRRIDALRLEERNEAFITCWTRKEACVKAIGEGVWSAFGRFEVSLERGASASVLTVDGDSAAAAEWSLYHIEPAEGYVGALAVRGLGWRVSGGTLDFPETEM
jgi:4'-phosphopantetheinyl transferase